MIYEKNMFILGIVIIIGTIGIGLVFLLVGNKPEEGEIFLTWELKTRNNPELDYELPMTDAWLEVASHSGNEKIFIGSFPGIFQGEGKHFTSLPKNTVDNFYTWYSGMGEVVIVVREPASLSIRTAPLSEDQSLPPESFLKEIKKINIEKDSNIRILEN